MNLSSILNFVKRSRFNYFANFTFRNIYNYGRYGLTGTPIISGWIGFSLFRSDQDRSNSIKDAIQRVLPATVQLSVQVSGKHLEGHNSILITNGTGFIISEDGCILTNAHVVGDVMTGGHLRISYNDGFSSWGRVVALDLVSDLAIIKPDDLPKTSISVTEGRSDNIYLGELVATIGNPYGLRNSVSVGVVGGKNRTSDDAQTQDDRVRYIQTDLKTNPGSSGSPLFCRDGKVIGMITAKSEVDGISFAIQLDSVKEMVLELLNAKRIWRPWIGIKGVSLNPFLLLQVRDCKRRDLWAEIKNGLLVTKVYDNSPGSHASIRPGDVITEVNGSPVYCIGDILVHSSLRTPDLQVTISRIDNDTKTLKRFQKSIHTDEFDILLHPNSTTER